ncbi:restriction endonuclease [Burkholderia cepacia]|uniref:restriction endonuclease n=1 Tax=Burkholderia cepacia TaxID=292 RepID=UPI00265222FA|nr:restriction endonuclease [Burkholderia cepacia]MDN7909915.1 restriction endonuclease [Burkholderia cepacia]
MNVFRDFFLGIDPDEWEYFAVDFLSSLGYIIERPPSRGADGGLDAIVSANGKSYLVSCKHKILSNNAVGIDDEKSILDRIIQHKTDGFLGFYSTQVSTPLQGRFDGLTESGYPCFYFDGNTISDYLPQISSSTLQKYGSPKEFKYSLNIPEYNYRPLPCLECETDILQESMIRRSLAQISKNDNGELEYIYGCKICFDNTSWLGWVELSQALHIEQLNGWVAFVDEALETNQPSSTFYKHRSQFEGAIQQRMFPINWGKWLGP